MENMKVPELKALAKERGLRRYSKLRKAELIASIQEGPLRDPRTAESREQPLPRCDSPLSQPPSPQRSQGGVNSRGARFRPDRPTQPELLRQLEERQSNPLTARQIKRRRNKLNKLNKQVKSSERELENLRSKRDSIIDKIEVAHKFGPKRRKRIRRMNRELTKIDEKVKESENKLENTTSKLNIMEPAPLKRVKRIKKKIAEINKKIRRAKKKNREALMAKKEALIRELKEEEWNPEVRILAGTFSRSYRRYRVDGRPRMDPDTFFNRIRRNLIDSLKQESRGRSTRVQTTTWIRF